MELQQLRARYPHPRLTLEEAAQFSDEQIEAIIALNDKKDEHAAEAMAAKEELKKAEERNSKLRNEVFRKEEEAAKVREKMVADGGAEIAALSDW